MQVGRKGLGILAVALLGMGFIFGLGVSFTQDNPQVIRGTPAGYSASPCGPLTIKVPDSHFSGGVVDVFPLSISFETQVWHTAVPGIPADTSRPADSTFYNCNELVVNSGLDWLAKLDGQNSTGSPVYMTATTGTTFAATDTTCQTPYTLNGFSKQNTMATYTHTAGTNTYTVFGQWTYTGSTAVTLAGACLNTHSSGAADSLVDETALGSTATVNANGDILKVTATVTV